MKKSPNIVIELIVCEAIRKDCKFVLDNFAENAIPKAVAAVVVTSSELVCTKSSKQRFADVLMGACMNLVSC